MAVLGIDWGGRRIGLAVSDADGRVALPAGQLQSCGQARDIATLCALVRERGIDEVVVGLPLHLDGGKGESARAAQGFADALRVATGLPVATFDERLSSVEAERALAEGGRRARRRREQSLDAMAATILLRAYLEQRKPETRAGEDRA